MSVASTSPASSPPQDTAKNPRVCLNCRRKKKRCDKALPSCSRCIDSLQVCQYDEEGGLSGGFCSPGPSFHLPQSMIISGQRWGTVSPGLFMALDTVEDIHSFTSRCLSEVLGSQTTSSMSSPAISPPPTHGSQSSIESNSRLF
ncbi:hypothetical protein QBC45DRAFT_190061 [Copromyces sp. CBS 386.78]|nr:hypothetical protein QBC45DRAFT_190061 [Copromyces sp. CBS 386.78]